MYLVEKGFANNKISATKGKVIDIKDKSLANALVKAGYISNYSKKEMSNKEMNKTIEDLNKQLAEKDNEIQSLKDKITELEQKINIKEENEDNLDEETTNNEA